MKNLKKLGASLLALVMALAMVAPAMAAPTDVTLAPTDLSATHTYKAYQVFTGDLNTDDTFVADSFHWAEKGVDVDGLVAALKALSFTGGDNPFAAIEGTEANDVANALYNGFMKPGNTLGSNKDDLQTLANTFAEYIGTDAPEYTMEGDSKTAKVPSGYYVLVEINDGEETNRLLAANEADTTKTIPISTKTGDSTVTKEVQTVEGAWADGAIYDKDSEIPFKLSVTLPTNLKTSGTAYNMVLHDVMDPGLDVAYAMANITAVTLTHKDKTTTTISAGDGKVSTYRVEAGCTDTENPIDGCSFEIIIENLEQFQSAAGDDVLTVEYTSKLTEDAEMNFIGNTNEVILTVNGVNKGNDKVKVYDLELTINKVNGATTPEPLDGAEFTLYDAKPTGDWVNNVFVPGEDNTANVVGTFTANGATHTLADVKEGTYWLVETKVPDNYNPAEMQQIVIEGKFDDKDGTILEAIDISGNVQFSRGTVVTNEDGTTTDNTNKMIATIQNLQGITLPSTGGIGTTIFYILGGALAVGAVVLLITKRRVGSSDDE